MKKFPSSGDKDQGIRAVADPEYSAGGSGSCCEIMNVSDHRGVKLCIIVSKST